MKLHIKKIGVISLILIIGGASLFFGPFRSSHADNQVPTELAGTANLTNIIGAIGDVEAQNQANLTFLTSGRIAYLGVKEGDQVKEGTVLANLDTTIASHSVTAYEAQYRSAQSALNKILDDIHLFQYGNGGFSNVGSANETQTQTMLRQQAEEAVNVAYDSLQSARKQLELQSIIAPFDGKVLSIQNISVGTNVSPTAGSAITVVGGGELKFVANILEQNINQIHEGMPVTIKLDAKKDVTLTGIVKKIAADKTVLADGRNVIKVEIQSDSLQANIQAGQTGTIEIGINQTGIQVAPSWTVLANKYIWVLSNGKTELKEVKIGLTVDGKTAITAGLLQNDQVILNPEIIARNKYKLL